MQHYGTLTSACVSGSNPMSATVSDASVHDDSCSMSDEALEPHSSLQQSRSVDDDAANCSPGNLLKYGAEGTATSCIFSGNPDSFRSFAFLLSDFGLWIKHMEGDGNCLFRAFLDQIRGDDWDHLALRAQTVRYVIENKKIYESFIQDEESFEAYCSRMMMDGVWGGHIELHALSMIHQVNIIVHQQDLRTCEICVFPEDSPCVQLSYHNMEHYNSVRLWGDDGSGSARSLSIVEFSVYLEQNRQLSPTNVQEKLLRIKDVTWRMKVRECMEYVESDFVEAIEACLDEMNGDVASAAETFSYRLECWKRGKNAEDSCGDVGDLGSGFETEKKSINKDAKVAGTKFVEKNEVKELETNIEKDNTQSGECHSEANSEIDHLDIQKGNLIQTRPFYSRNRNSAPKTPRSNVGKISKSGEPKNSNAGHTKVSHPQKNTRGTSAKDVGKKTRANNGPSSNGDVNKDSSQNLYDVKNEPVNLTKHKIDHDPADDVSYKGLAIPLIDGPAFCNPHYFSFYGASTNDGNKRCVAEPEMNHVFFSIPYFTPFNSFYISKHRLLRAHLQPQALKQGNTNIILRDSQCNMLEADWDCKVFYPKSS